MASHGEFVWNELHTRDVERAKAFYSAVFGWEFQAFPGPSEYHMTRISEDSGAAITNNWSNNWWKRP